MGKQRTEIIEIKIPASLKNEFFIIIKKKYGNLKHSTVNNVVLNIFEEWLIQTNMDENLEHSSQSGLDAYSTENEDDDVFCDPMGVFPGSPDPPGVFNPEDGVFPVEWNGNKNQNITRARAQVTFLLDAKDYPVLGRRLMNKILSIVESKQETGFLEEWKL